MRHENTKKEKLQSPYIAIEGNIGAGKTSLCNMLAEDLSANLLLENFDENPFLPLFYQNQAQYALSVELFFMTERHEKMKAWLLEQSLPEDSLSRQKYYIADYIFSKTLLFAHKTLSVEEWQLFQRIFEALNAHTPQPDLLVYLHRPVEELQAHIRRRNRSYEQRITAEYLQGIESAYFEFFEQLPNSHSKNTPVLFLDISGLDFVHNPEHYETIKTMIQQKYSAGIHKEILKIC